MKLFLTFLQAILIASIFLGCTTTYKLKTKPEKAKVFAGENLIGESPVVFSASDLNEANANGFNIRVEKAGYKTLYVWVPNTANEFDIELNLNPLYRRESGSARIDDHSMTRRDLNKLTDMLLQLQSGIMFGGEVDGKSIDGILDANPTLGSIHFLKAVEQLRSGKTDEARLFLTEAIRFSPEEFDFLALLNEVGQSDKP